MTIGTMSLLTTPITIITWWIKWVINTAIPFIVNPKKKRTKCEYLVSQLSINEIANVPKIYLPGNEKIGCWIHGPYRLDGACLT